MIGIDTSFLIAWAIQEHPEHAICRALSTEAAQDGATLDGAGLHFGDLPGLLKSKVPGYLPPVGSG